MYHAKGTALYTFLLVPLSWIAVGYSAEPHRSPVDLAVSPNGSWLVTANQTSDSISLVRVSDGKILDEQPAGLHPTNVTLANDGRQVMVTARDSGELLLFRVNGERLTTLGKAELGFHPCGVAVSPDDKTAYVALAAAGEVAVVELASQRIAATIEVGRRPRFPVVSPDGSRLAVGVAGERGIAVVDTTERKLLYTEKFTGLNLGHLVATKDNQRVVFPWMIYRALPITAENIRLGWVWASRLGRVRLDGPARREAISLDPRGEAIADPFGIDLTSEEDYIVASAGGTHELLIFHTAGLPWQDTGGTDHIDGRLLRNRERFDRIELGGRPLGLEIGPDDNLVYVANYLLDAVQVVDLSKRSIVRTFPLGGPTEPSLARRGEAIFYDGRRSLDQWYSCHTCHHDGGGNAITIDTHNDGTTQSFKTVTPLWHVHQTSPWTWHGWQKDLRAAMNKSITSTMVGPKPSDEDVDAMIAYLQTIEPPTNPYRAKKGALAAAAVRGEKVFHGETAGCANCHSGPLYTDGEIHDVGLGRKRDAYQGYNTPSLVGVHQKLQLLHDGRAKSLEEVLTGAHSPEEVTGNGKLSDQQLADLIAFLKSL